MKLSEYGFSLLALLFFSVPMAHADTACNYVVVDPSSTFNFSASESGFNCAETLSGGVSTFTFTSSGGGGPVNIYTGTLSGSTGNYGSGVGYRAFFPASVLGAHSGGHISVTVCTASGSANAFLNKAYVGIASGSGPNDTAAPVQLTWGGNASFAAQGAGCVASDYVAFTYASGQPLTVNLDWASGSGTVNVATGVTGTPPTDWWLANNANQAPNATCTGCNLNSQVQEFVSSISVEP